MAPGDWGTWRRILEQAYKASILQDDVNARAEFALLLAQAYQSLGDYQDALEYALLAEELFQTLHDQTSYGLALTRAGGILVDMGKLDEAQAKFLVALDILSRVGGLELSRVHHGLTRVHFRRGEYAAARDQLQRAQTLKEKESLYSGDCPIRTSYLAA